MSRAERFIDWCDKAMAFSFYALIYFLPISIALSETFTGLALAFYLLKRFTFFCVHAGERTEGERPRSFLNSNPVFFFRSFAPPANYLNKPVLIFLFFNLISVFISKHLMLSIEGFLGKVLQSAFLYFNFIEAINSKKRLKKFLIAFLASATLVSINGLYQHFIGKDFIYGHLVYDGRVSSSFRAHNDFAAYLIVVAPIFLSLSVLSAVNDIKQFSGDYPGKYIFPPFFPGKWKALIFVIFILSLICLGYTFSRGAWIAFAFVMLIFSVQKKRYIIINGLILILFFSFFYPQLKETRQVSFIADSVSKKDDVAPLDVGPLREVRLEDQSTQNNVEEKTKTDIQTPALRDETKEAAVLKPVKEEFHIMEAFKEKLELFSLFGGSGRSGYWREAVHMIKDYPVFGVGLNTYSVVGKGYKITWGGYPHNCYLQMAVETGILGLLSFLWVAGVLLYRSIQNLAHMRDPLLAMFLLGSLIGLGGFLVHSSFDTNFYSVQLGSFMWLIMGLIVAVQKIDKEVREQ